MDYSSKHYNTSLAPDKAHLVIRKHGTEALMLPGEQLFEENTHPKGIYFIKSGKIATKQLNSSGENQIINIHTKGEILGIRSCLQQNKMDKTAYALEKSVYIFMPIEAFIENLTHYPGFNFYTSQKLEKNIKEIENRATVLLQRPAAERLAYMILVFQNKFGEKEGFLNIVLPIKDYARLIGTTRTTVYRLFKSFTKNKWINCDKSNHIQICNKEALQQLSPARM